MERFRCDNCDWTGSKPETHSAKDLFMRLDYNGPFTDRECPECGCLAYYESIEENESKYSHVVLHYSAFDIARLGKEQLYAKAQEVLATLGIHDKVLDMDMVPVGHEEQVVTYECRVTEMKKES